MATNWHELHVSNSNGEEIGTLSEVIDRSDDSLRYASLCEAGGPDWQHYYLATDDEEPAWDTPRVPIDWTGFPEALATANERLRTEDEEDV